MDDQNDRENMCCNRERLLSRIGDIPFVVYPTVAALSLTYALLLFPIEFVLGHGPYWDGVRADSQTSLIGLRYFLADSWRFPLLQTRLLIPPDGVNIVYTDSVPLFALATKLVRSVLPPDPNYLGVWYVTVFVLQGVGAVFLLRSFSINTLLPQLSVALLALSSPAFLFRSTLHPSLSGHFVILVALALYFRSVRWRPSVWRWTGFAALVLVSLLIHAYLFVMVVLIFAVALAQQLASDRTLVGQSIAVGTLTAIVTGVAVWITGYLSGAGDTTGFGHYSMNLLSPWMPQRSGLFRSMDQIIDATGGQYEGYNYMGAGVLLLLGLTAVAGRWNCSSIATKYWALTLLLAVFSLLAISNRVFVGQTAALEIVATHGSPQIEAIALTASTASTPSDTGPAVAPGEFPLVKRTLQHLRASGRFFWPAGYVLLTVGIVGVGRWRGLLGVVVIVAATTLQVVDATQLRQDLTHTFDPSVPLGESSAPLKFPPDDRWDESAVDATLWQPFIAPHQKLVVVPNFECAELNQRWHVLDLVFHASASATPANTAYLARSSFPKDCDAPTPAEIRDHLASDHLVVFLTSPETARLPPPLATFSDTCRSFRLGYACTRSWQWAPRGDFIPALSADVLESR